MFLLFPRGYFQVNQPWVFGGMQNQGGCRFKGSFIFQTRCVCRCQVDTNQPNWQLNSTVFPLFRVFASRFSLIPRYNMIETHPNMNVQTLVPEGYRISRIISTNSLYFRWNSSSNNGRYFTSCSLKRLIYIYIYYVCALEVCIYIYIHICSYILT